MMNENEFINLCEYLVSGKYEKMNVSFTTPLVRFVYTHQMMPLTLLFAYMASTLRLPTTQFGIIELGSVVGQLLDGLFGDAESSEGEEST